MTRADGPTLTPETADYGVLVRVLGSTLNRGLSGYISGGENTERVEVQFDDGTKLQYDVNRLQLYTPRGQIERHPKMWKKRNTVTPRVSTQHVSPQRPHAVVTEPETAEQRRRRKPVSTEPAKPEKPPKEKIKRGDADWNF
jgi:hypothetical protein